MTGYTLSRSGCIPTSIWSLRKGAARPGAPQIRTGRPALQDTVAGIPCRRCGAPHAHVVCDCCGNGDHLRLACDRCGEWQPFDLIGLIRVRAWRVVAGLALAFAAGVLAAAFSMGRKTKW